MIPARIGRGVLWAVALAFVATTVAGVVNYYSPVPFADMWDGYLDFYLRVTAGDAGAWWAQHNEHRPLLARIAFWIDIRWLGGRSLLLLPLNFALMAALWYALVRSARRLVPARGTGLAASLAPPLLAIACFSWLQEENFGWGFQVQFFAAFLLPLAGLLALARAAGPERSRASRGWFAAAVALGSLAAGTMANGILALPLQVAMAALTRQGARRVAILAIAATATIALYFHGWHTPPVPDGIVYDPEIVGADAPHRVLKKAAHFLVFLGAPFAVALHGLAAGVVAGALFVGAFAYCALAWWRGRAADPVFVALLAFAAYVMISAATTAQVRWVIGLAQATSSRYMTASLLGWAALAVLLASLWRTRGGFRRVAMAVAIAFPVALAPFQWAAVTDDPTNRCFEKWLAALGLELGIRDRDVIIGKIYWAQEPIGRIAAAAARRNLSVFGDPRIADARAALGRDATTLAARPCLGAIDRRVPAGGEPGVARIYGWAFDHEAGGTPTRVYLADASGRIVGVGIGGAPRLERAAIVDAGNGSAGFAGYQFDETLAPRILCATP